MATNLSPVFFEASSAATMSSLEISEMVKSRHDSVRRTIERLYAADVIVQPPLVNEQSFDSMGRPRATEVYLFSGAQGRRDSIVVVAQLSPEFTASIVDRWQELENKAPEPALTTPAAERATVGMAVAAAAARILRIEGVPLLGYITDVAEQFSPEAARALPSYGANRPAGSVFSANSELTRSLTDLLKIQGVNSIARNINPLLIAAGILEKKTRPSSKGGTKEFLSVTERGLQYGINQTAKQNQLETSPRFFESRFRAMMIEIGQAI
jgi:phage regulator Rha-like protein